MFVPLRKLLPKKVERAAAERRAREGGVLARASGILARVFGAETAARMRPSSVAEGVLFVVCDVASHCREIRAAEGTIVAMLNEGLDAPAVRRVYPRT